MSKRKSSKQNASLKSTDVLMKDYIKDKEVFADAFNYFLYGGERVIQPEQLQLYDTNRVVVPYGETDTGIDYQTVQKLRDSLLSVMTDDARVYMLCGIENQTENHYAMPVRNALYDIMEYAAQVNLAAKDHRAAKNYGSDSGEFLSGFQKTDRLIPVYTLVIYWSSEEWDGPRSLFEMLDVKDESDYYGLNDWKLNLISPRDLTEEEALEKFGSELGKALIYAKNMGNPEALDRIYHDDRFRILETKTALMVNHVMNAGIQIERKEKKIDMCYAIEKLKADAVKEATEKMAIKAEKATRKATVLATIETLRDVGFTEDEIKKRIMEKYNLIEEEAAEYMAKKSA